MKRLKIVTLAFLALASAVRTEKKIELQDIEEDNLKSEKQIESESNRPGTEREMIPLEYLKSGLLRYFENINQPQSQRYVHQYDVNEPQETVRPTHEPSKPLFQPAGSSQQAMVGYLSNVPMQIYLVPQYYGDQEDRAPSAPASVQFTGPTAAATHSSPTAPSFSAPEANSSPTNYIQVPSYVNPSAKTYTPSGPQHITYVINSHPTAASPHLPLVTAPGASGPSGPQVLPQIFYQMPMLQYPTALVAPPVYPKGYYPQYIDSNTVEDHQNEVNHEKYITQSEAPYTKSVTHEYPRYYPTKASLRDEQRHSTVSELPSPNPLLLRSPPQHLSHIPKTLPMYRPISKPVYATSGSVTANTYTQRPNDAYGVPFRKRPKSLLESYIPSSVQLEYLNRGYAKDPLSVYDVLSNSRHNYSPTVTPRQYERGFLPNQMYHTAAGGVTFGHYKRGIKTDKYVRNSQ